MTNPIASTPPHAAPHAAPRPPEPALGDAVVLTALDERRRAERALDAIGRPVPLHARVTWAEAFVETPSALAALRTRGGGYAAAVGIAMTPSRALPGHQIWRVDRVTDAVPVETAARLLRFVVGEARRRRRVLRIETSVLARSGDFRRTLQRELLAMGYKQIPAHRTYDYTLVLDLGDEATMLAALSRQTRRNVRAVERQPVTIRPIADPALAARMAELMRETLARTGGVYHDFNWAAAMRVSAAEPARSRLIGMFRTDVDGPEALLAFSWGMHHGDHAVYDAGASTRATDVRVAMAYPLIWDLITWARQNGAAWFDFGGVTRPQPGAVDALAGISEFKRSFSRQVEEVGEEYVIETAPVRSAVARALGSGAQLIHAAISR